jgi:hypothetical protein
LTTSRTSSSRSRAKDVVQDVEDLQDIEDSVLDTEDLDDEVEDR